MPKTSLSALLYRRLAYFEKSEEIHHPLMTRNAFINPISGTDNVPLHGFGIFLMLCAGLIDP